MARQSREASSYLPQRMLVLPVLAINSASLVPTIADMAQALEQSCPASDADALKLLREMFPSAPFALRVAALEASHRVG